MQFFNFVVHFSSSLMIATCQNQVKTNRIKNKMLYSTRNTNIAMKLDIF